MNLSYSQIRKIYNDHGFKFYQGKFNINLFGIRAKSSLVDHFNDTLGVAFLDDYSNGVCLTCSGTTKPGLYFLGEKNMGNPKGTFILKEGHYPSCWMRGDHRTYDALIQSDKATFVGWRDRDKDGELDYSGPLYYDVTGLNMHTTSFINKKARVGAYSAGCQVRQYSNDHVNVMGIVKKSLNLYGKYLSYALFNERDIHV